MPSSRPVRAISEESLEYKDSHLLLNHLLLATQPRGSFFAHLHMNIGSLLKAMVTPLMEEELLAV